MGITTRKIAIKVGNMNNYRGWIIKFNKNNKLYSAIKDNPTFKMTLIAPSRAEIERKIDWQISSKNGLTSANK